MIKYLLILPLFVLAGPGDDSIKELLTESGMEMLLETAEPVKVIKDYDINWVCARIKSRYRAVIVNQSKIKFYPKKTNTYCKSQIYADLQKLNSINYEITK